MLVFHCMACGDARPVLGERRHCLCGRSSAWACEDKVIVAGPGRVNRDQPVLRDADDVAVFRPSVAVGT
ncbi:MAG TPA: hypothetical protein VF235_04460 [Actinomycetota bacterium]